VPLQETFPREEIRERELLFAGMRSPALKRIAIGALLLALAAAAIVFWRARPGEPPAQGPQLPPATVAAARAEQELWRTRIEAVGSLQAERGVEVTTEAAGIVSAIRFDSGERVRAGEVIIELNAKADRARLATLASQLEQARADLARNRRLAKGGAVSRVQLEQSQTAVETLQAQVIEQHALLERKTIEAPFAGELGIRLVDLGELVQPGAPIVTLQQIAPILVDFSLPERHYGRLAAGQPIELRVDAHPRRAFAGTVSAINPRVDAQTRNFRVQGRLPNEERLLRPGMFASLAVILPDEREVVTVPATAVTYSPSGDSVFVVRESQTVARLPVKTGERRGARVAILEGVAPGDRVVTAGQLKLFEGAPVTIAQR
jgi:RND family efflux transporter MFP subunit